MLSTNNKISHHKTKLQPETFEFGQKQIQGNRIVFEYKITFKNRTPLKFKETIILPSPPKDIPLILKKRILNIVHLALGISYFKTYLPPKIKLSQDISKSEARFWQIVYTKGLGELFYRNSFAIKNIVFPTNLSRSQKFIFDKKTLSFISSFTKNSSQKILLGVGGGKDSVVAIEMLKEQGFSPVLFVVETNRSYPVTEDIIKVSGLKALKIKRIIDEKLLNHALDKEIKGHIPISAIYASLGAMASLFYGFHYFVVANEFSSNFGNVKYQSMTINHQWSKTSEYEILFNNYLREQFGGIIEYFSLLRPFYEIRVAEMFSKYKQYFPYFSSCNQTLKISNSSSKRWCLNCPKCAFVFGILAPFLTKKELLQIFGENLFEKESLIPTFKSLAGFGQKPFECVGTPEEFRTALLLSEKKHKNSLILKALLPRLKKHPVKKEVVSQIFSTQPSPNLPHQFRFCGVKNVLLLGYGREGKATRNYIKTRFPQLKIGIADKRLSKDYLKKQSDYDLIIKTPGIPREKVFKLSTTATNIFFSQQKGYIVGITGSKGKSTTASMIYHILKRAGKDVQLLGNIGRPAIEALGHKSSKETIFVLELSSYQLSDIRYSPHVAVITSLFPEHLDYHKTLQNYYESKKNIIRFQKPTDYFIFNPKNKILKQWSKNALSRSLAPLFSAIPKDFNLQGEHNIMNAALAAAAAKVLGIDIKTIKNSLKTFSPLPHRLEYVDKINEILFYNDAASTTPESTIEAIKTLKRIGTIILGGTDRGYNFNKLERTLKKFKIKNVVLFPESGKRILTSKKDFNILFTKSMAEAVEFAFQKTPKGEICLLSTASPSYSLWENFEEKGNQFKFFVKNYNPNKKNKPKQTKI